MAASEDFAAVLDSLIVCKFPRECFSEFYTEVVQFLSQPSRGGPTLAAELRCAGERIHTLEKAVQYPGTLATRR